jgi:hypothetical protein
MALLALVMRILLLQNDRINLLVDGKMMIKKGVLSIPAVIYIIIFTAVGQQCYYVPSEMNYQIDRR